MVNHLTKLVVTKSIHNNYIKMNARINAKKIKVVISFAYCYLTTCGKHINRKFSFISF